MIDVWKKILLPCGKKHVASNRINFVAAIPLVSNKYFM